MYRFKVTLDLNLYIVIKLWRFLRSELSVSIKTAYVNTVIYKLANRGRTHVLSTSIPNMVQNRVRNNTPLFISKWKKELSNFLLCYIHTLGDRKTAGMQSPGFSNLLMSLVHSPCKNFFVSSPLFRNLLNFIFSYHVKHISFKMLAHLTSM